MDILGTALSIVSPAGGSIANLIAGRKKAKQAEAALNNAFNEIQNAYGQAISQTKNTSATKLNLLNSLQNADYTQRSEIQKAYSDMAKAFRNQAKQMAQSQFVTGASDSSINAARANMANTMGNTFQNIASAASAYKDRLEGLKLGTMDAYTSAINNLYTSRGRSLASLYQNKANILLNASAANNQAAAQSMQDLGNLAMMAMML